MTGQVAVAGTYGHVPGVSFMSDEAAVRAIGNNSGNLLFQYAVTRLIDEPFGVVGQDIPWGGVRRSARALVVPSANFLREGADMTGFVDFLERTELPLLFIGLGAQADDAEKVGFDFHPSIERLIALIRERSPRVAVRGEFTAKVLERHGVTDVEVTGCPSNLINAAPAFPSMIAAKLARRPRSFVAHAEEPWPKKPVKRDVDRRLIEWVRTGRGVLVQQSVPRMISYLRSNNPHSGEDPGENFGEALRKAMMPDVGRDAFEDFVATRVRTYWAVDQWLEDSAKFDFSIGLRLHGNMVAWQSGTPALWITHDTRTRELVDTMALPGVDLPEFLENCPTLESAWERTEFDPEAYAARRDVLRGRLARCFDAFGIAMVPPA